MKTLNILGASLLLAAAPLLAQDEYFWTVASNPDGEAVAAWADNMNFDVRAATCSGGTWSSYEIIPNSDETYPYPICLAMDAAGNIVLVWGDSFQGLILSSIKLVSEDWTNGVVISSISNYSSEPVLSMDSAGNATVVWSDYSQGLQASTLPAGTTTWSVATTITD